MQIYLVGGAVRDKLLKREVVDRDFVVVGATPQQMLDKGYIQVGKDFPVFLHPQTKEEYALARLERKTGRGYKGFAFDSSPNVTLKDDLKRRDLTINAMAMDDAGNIIDPYGGLDDLNQRRLRHVSDAFIEDPLRVFRVARFAARYQEYGFAIDGKLLTIMRQIADSGELKALTAQRVWQETSRALMENHPGVYFTTLKAVDALKYWFMELDLLWGIPNPSLWHPEIDTGVHSMMVVQQAVELSDKLSIRYAALVHDLGKAKTDTTRWPSHHQHDELGINPIKALSDRLSVPNDCRELAMLVSEHHSMVHRLHQKSPEQILNTLNICDYWRRPQRFEDFLIACKADFLGRKNFSQRQYTQADEMMALAKQCSQVEATKFVEEGLKGLAIKQAINDERIAIIADFLKSHRVQN